MSQTHIVRLTAADVASARTLFTMMASVFDSEAEELSDGYLVRLLRRDDVWAYAALSEGEPVGGLTAFTLPLTTAEGAELFIYDIAVLPRWQRRGVGRALISALRVDAANAGIAVAFVPADSEDTHALDFYRALGGTPSPVTIFTFGDSEE